MSSDPQEGGRATGDGDGGGDLETGGAGRVVVVGPRFKDQVRTAEAQPALAPRHQPKTPKIASADPPTTDAERPLEDETQGTPPLVTAAEVPLDTTNPRGEKKCHLRCNCDYEVERYKLYWALSVFAAVVITLAIVVGSFCGAGRCKETKETKSLAPPSGCSPTSLPVFTAPTTTQSTTNPIVAVCERTIGPFTSTVNGGELAFQFAGLPDATGNVTVRISYRGDFGASDEYATILGEGGAEIGIAARDNGGACDTTPQEEDFVVAQNTFNGWNEDLTVELSVEFSDGTGNAGVDADGCAGDLAGIAAEVSLTLLYDAQGGCP